MIIYKLFSGANNLIGAQLAMRRKSLGLSQKKSVDRLQSLGLDVDKNAIQRIECGKRFVTDIVLIVICKALEIDPNELLQWNHE